MTGPSEATAEKVADALRALASDEDLRGSLVQQGGLKAALKLAEEGANSEKGRVHAAHAVGKILVTTDPRGLTDAQRLAGIRPLLWACRQPRVGDLVHFEACLRGAGITVDNHPLGEPTT